MRDVLRRYARLRAWVQRERRRLERKGARPSQQYLRRSRLVDDVDPITLRELMRELQDIARPSR